VEVETLKSEVAQPQIVEVKSNASGCGCSSAEGETEKTKINQVDNYNVYEK